MDTSSLTPVAVQARVHPRRRHCSAANSAAAVVEKPVAQPTHSEPSEVRRRFVDIYEQASRIAYRSE